MNLYKKELYFAAGTFLLSIYIVWQSFSYAISSSLFPRFISLLLMILSFILLIKKWIFNINKKQAKNKVKCPSLLFVTLKNPALFVLILLFIYIYGMNYGGYVISTVIFIGITMFLLGQRNLFLVIFMAVFFTIILFYVFSKLLNVPLPTQFF